MTLSSWTRTAKISIHAAREGGDTDGSDEYARIMISIHAAREGGDQYALFVDRATEISIHAAREGGDRRTRSLKASGNHFNPRRP